LIKDIKERVKHANTLHLQGLRSSDRMNAAPSKAKPRAERSQSDSQDANTAVYLDFVAEVVSDQCDPGASQIA